MNEAALEIELQEVLARLEDEPSHVLHVTALALQIFDQLSTWHKLGTRERGLLAAAGKLHDVGWSVAPDGKRHHKESARLIREQTWKGLTAGEVELVAMIARYHRKALPSDDHEDYAALDPAAQIIVRKLAGILRVADGLDRSHLQIVERVELQLNPGRAIFLIATNAPALREMATAKKKGDLLEKELGGELMFEAAGTSFAQIRVLKTPRQGVV